MATYTMQLRTLIEQPSQYETGLSVKDVIEKGRQTLFDFDYPIFDENYRKVFETHFIRHFYMREIGFETEGLFKFQLETWLMIHMPFFNRMFESELLEFDPLVNTKMDVTHNRKNDRTQNDQRDSTRNSTSSGTSESTASSDATASTSDDQFNRDIEADTPDNRLQLTANDGEGLLDYASKVSENTQNNSTTANSSNDSTQTASGESQDNTTQNDQINSTINDIEDFIEHRAGKVGAQTYSKMLQEYRQTFMRIEQQIFDEMQQLFMLVY